MATTTQAPPQTDALAKKPQSLMQMLQASIPQIEMALPRHLTAERMIRVAITAIQKTPALQECSPRSVVGAVIQASQLGLEPDGVLGQAYLVPFKNKNTNQKEAQLQIGYRGFITLARRSGEVSSVYAELVYQCDKFEVSYGTDKKLVHVPDLDKPERGDRDNAGDLIGLRGAYAVVKYKDGSDDFEYMSLHDLDRIRATSKAQEFGPWQTHPAEMYRKCPIRRLAKRLPLSAEFMKAAVMDEYAEAGVVTGASELTDDINNAAASAGMKAENGLAERLREQKAEQERREAEKAAQAHAQKMVELHGVLKARGLCAAGSAELGYCDQPAGQAHEHHLVSTIPTNGGDQTSGTGRHTPAPESKAQETAPATAVPAGAAEPASSPALDFENPQEEEAPRPNRRPTPQPAAEKRERY